MAEWMSRAAIESIGCAGLGYSLDPLDSPATNPYTKTVRELMCVSFRDAQTTRIDRLKLEKPSALLHRAPPAGDSLRAKAGHSGFPAIYPRLSDPRRGGSEGEAYGGRHG